MAIYRLIKNIIPNFSDKQLRQMIPWFRQISQAVDGLQGNFKAAGQIISGDWADSGVAREGFTSTVGHPSNGLYNLTLSTPISVDPTVDSLFNYIALATLTSLGASEVDIFEIGVTIVDASTVRVRTFNIDSGSGEVTPADHDFFIYVFKMPGAPATA
jgi:hypothetical protein